MPYCFNGLVLLCFLDIFLSCLAFLFWAFWGLFRLFFWVLEGKSKDGWNYKWYDPGAADALADKQLLLGFGAKRYGIVLEVFWCDSEKVGF